MHELPKIDKFKETKSRTVVAQARESGVRCAVTAREYRVSSDGNENVLKLIVITAAQTDEHNYSLYVHFKRQKCMIWEL